jgi:hypothetical protein
MAWGPQHGEGQPDKWTPAWPWNETTRLSGRITYFNGFDAASPINICEQWTPGFIVPSNFGDTARFFNCDLFKANI